MRKTLLALIATTALGAPAMAQDMNIIETAVGAGSFTTLVAAVEAAGLVETLSGEGPSPSSPPRTTPLPPFPKAPSKACFSPKTGISWCPS
jgi:hypothetical protein